MILGPCGPDLAQKEDMSGLASAPNFQIKILGTHVEISVFMKEITDRET